MERYIASREVGARAGRGDMGNRLTWFFPVVALLGTLAALAGCQLPNVQPFAEGVAAVHAAVDESGVVFRDSAASVLPPTDKRIAKLETHWRKRLATTAALSEYADSLASIVDAGNSGRESARELDSAVGALMEQVGVAGLAGSVAFQIGGEIYSLVSQGLAAKALDEAVANAGLAVARSCMILVDDLKTIRSTLDVLEQDALATAETDEYNDELHHPATLKAQRTMHLGRFVGESNEPDPKLWRDNHAEIVPQIEALDRLITESQAVVDEGNARIDAVRRSYEAKRALLDQAIAAVQLVAREHARLAHAIKAKRAINACTLLYSANQIAATIDRIEKIRETERD